MTSTGFNIFSWNVNGLRTINISDTLKKLKCSILAIQETKLQRDDLKQEVALIDSFTSYFSFCSTKSGYSGVATYCMDGIMPIKSEEGLSGLINRKKFINTDNLIGSYGHVENSQYSNAKLADDSGRSILTQHKVQTPNGETKLLTIINVYCPRLQNDPGEIDNTDFKFTFHTTLGKRAKSLVEAGSFVIILGDLNISHKPNDRVEAEDSEIFSGNIFRKWMDEILSEGFQDTFRMLHPNVSDGFSCWCTRTNARQNNYGSRIDYIIVDTQLSEYLEKAEIHSDVLGSDHCPISATFHSLTPVPSKRVPLHATKNYPEFSGKQTNLKDFLIPSNTNNISEELYSSQKCDGTTVPTKKKRSLPAGGKQTDIASFFIKKVKIEDQTENSTVTVQKATESQNENGVDKSETSFSAESSESQCNEKSFLEINQDAKNRWKMLMKSPGTPSCSGHNEPCTLRTVKKKGMNLGRKYWACPRGVGKADDPNGNCNFFEWLKT